MKLMISVKHICLMAYAVSVLGCSAVNVETGNVHNATAPTTEHIAQNQRLLFVSNQDGDREIYTTRADGSELVQLTRNERDDYDARWSPDGNTILFTSLRDGGNSEIYLMQADGSQQRNLTHSPGFDGQARWSPDGNTIVFSSDRADGTVHLFTMRPDGSAVRQLTSDKDASYNAAEWSPDGKWIAYRKLTANNKADTWLVDARTLDHWQLTNNPKHNDGEVSWSPDSSQVVYHSRRNREFNIYVYDLTRKQERQLTHLHASDSQPQWSHHSDSILFLSTRGPHGRTQLHIMKEDGSQQRSYSDAQYQVDDATWLADDSGILMVSWQGGRYSNVVVLDLAEKTLSVIAPANGYQSQPFPKPVVLPESSKQLASVSTRQALH